jgi:hypothetical protein
MKTYLEIRKCPEAVDSTAFVISTDKSLFCFEPARIFLLGREFLVESNDEAVLIEGTERDVEFFESIAKAIRIETSKNILRRFYHGRREKLDCSSDVPESSAEACFFEQH